MDEHESIIWASGTFLTEPLPNDYNEMTEKKLTKFLTQNAWEIVQYYQAEEIMDFITDLAYKVRSISA